MTRSSKTVRILLILLSLVGFVAAFYLTLVHYRGDIPRCYVVEGCAVVQTSKYSTILSIPIALLGTLYFTLMFYGGIALLTVPARKVVLGYKILAFAGALVAVPLFLLQATVLHAYCTYCLVTEFVLVATWLASLALKAPAATPTEPRAVVKGADAS